MTKLLLVRHGQSEWNALGKWQGKADPPLTDLGRHQALLASKKLPDFSILASSDLKRAKATAEIFADTHNKTHDEVLIEPLVQERDAGEFSGLTRDEIETKFPGYLAQNKWPKGWEPDDSVIKRLHDGLSRVISSLTESDLAIVVTHGGCIYALENLLGAQYRRISNLGGRYFEFVDGQFFLGDRTQLLDPDEETYPDQI
ncbi:MAG: alpha-ribazole phosphatase [Acidimicrobiaceae bacterium]|jgi:probable phosphoglycerate mutase|nr:alpha-ribazole phosphatase [Acidimicrobiaceae bacterium]|tara:strand:- start:26311 stop:26910 length:600 start_codon:yes stop_codon:yes gene_type:complete